MLSIIIAESSLELIPKELQNAKVVISHAKRVNKEPSELLLDRTYHHFAMQRLSYAHKRGRPDLVHITLLSITSTPLYNEGLLNLYLHTIDDKVIILKNVRLPRNLYRFEGLMIDLFKKKRIVNNNMLIEYYEMSFGSLINLLKPMHVIALSRLGDLSSADKIAMDYNDKDVAIVIGGFPKGHFSNEIIDNVNSIIAISKYHLDSHVVSSRIVYEFEKLLIR
jgi:rRNA small subunit pseudouridine methyltransferase Nep1